MMQICLQWEKVSYGTYKTDKCNGEAHCQVIIRSAFFKILGQYMKLCSMAVIVQFLFIAYHDSLIVWKIYDYIGLVSIILPSVL